MHKVTQPIDSDDEFVPQTTSKKRSRSSSNKKQPKNASGGRPKKELEAYIFESYKELTDQLWEDIYSEFDGPLLEEVDDAIAEDINTNGSDENILNAQAIYESKLSTDHRFDKFLTKEDVPANSNGVPQGICYQLTKPTVLSMPKWHDSTFDPYKPNTATKGDRSNNTSYYPIYGDDFSDEELSDEDWCEAFDTVPVRHILKKRRLMSQLDQDYEWKTNHDVNSMKQISITFQQIMSATANFNPRTITPNHFLSNYVQSLRTMDQYFYQVDLQRDKDRMKEAQQKWTGVVAEAKFIKRDPIHLHIARLCRDLVVKRIEKTQAAQRAASAGAKKLNKEMSTFWKKHEKEVVEKRKRKLKEEQEKLEAQRQQRKLNFLLTQTELYSHFMAKKGINSTAALPNTLADPDDIDDAKKNAERAYMIQSQKTQSFDDSIIKYRSKSPSHQHVQPVTDTDEDMVMEPTIFSGQLKQYQLRGLRWLVSLYYQGINGILADEMGLGKTIQTIAFLSYLAEKRGIWGPFVIVSPSSTLHNWQQEIEKFCPDLKVLPYWGSVKDRKILRKFWSPPERLYRRDSPFHVMITSYGLILEDEKPLSKLQWQYLILDEAHAIKSSKSQRWQSLLNFKCRNRMLLTGTPIQNNMQELWALLHFIMPSLFDSHEEFNEWFSKDIENNATKLTMKKKNNNKENSRLDEQQLQRLHLILKPFMLRRVKNDVECEMAPKIENILYCTLNKQQSHMYSELRNIVKKAGNVSTTHNKSTTFGLSKKSLMNMVMHLRKVCNHPHLFSGNEQDIHSPFCFGPSVPFIRTLAVEITGIIPDVRSDHVDNWIEYCVPKLIHSQSSDYRLRSIRLLSDLIVINKSNLRNQYGTLGLYAGIDRWNDWIPTCHDSQLKLINQVNMRMYHSLFQQEEEEEDIIKKYPTQVQELCRQVQAGLLQKEIKNRSLWLGDSTHQQLIDSSIWRGIKFTNNQCSPIFCKPIQMICRNTSVKPIPSFEHFAPNTSRFVQLPSMSHIVGDSGKLYALDRLLMRLKKEGHRVLIFCQMTRMLDLLEYYMVRRHYRYFRMDGSTVLANRRDMVSQFQQVNSPVFAFLLSTRAGGLGINLTAADTVIFYDKDWNPTLDAQAMDRVHRIGQTKQVNIYHMVTRNTIEERIMLIARQKSTIQATVYGEGKKGSAQSGDISETMAIEDDPNPSVNDNQVAALLFDEIRKDQDIVHSSE